MTTRQINFYEYETGAHRKTPYICRQEPIEYLCDGKEGYIHFDGYYVENHAPLIQRTMLQDREDMTYGSHRSL
jgi:hypothetical protein